MAKSTLVVDSSQIATFLECPQKWYNYYVKRLEPLAMPDTDEAMNAGTFGHKLIEIYYRLKSRHLPSKEITDAVMAYNPDIDTCECGCPKDLHCPVPLFETEECTRCKKCTKFRPHPFKLDTKIRKKVYNRMRDYIGTRGPEDFVPLSENHVEVGFSEPIYEDSQVLFVLEGRIDLIGKQQGLDIFVDHKFQTSTHWLYPRSIQFKNYSMITGISTGIINYIRLTDKVDKNTCIHNTVNFNQIERDAWRKRLIQVFFRIKKALEASQMERNWNSCSGGFKTYDIEKPKFCWYRDMCEEFDPQMADRREKQFFKIKENVWRPW